MWPCRDICKAARNLRIWGIYNLRRQKNLQLKFARSPLVLLPEEVLFGEVDQVDHGLRGDEEMLVQHFNLREQFKTHTRS